MTIEQFSNTGLYHQTLGIENQDFLYGVEGKDYLAVMLADGATACTRGLDGARAACAAAEQAILQGGTSFFRWEKEKIAYLLREHILYCLECCKEEEREIHDYGSTFALAFMEKKTGRTVIVNLGDSAILSVNEEGVLYRLKPKRYRGNPCLTTTRGSEKAMEIDVINLALGESLVLCSDGLLDLFGRPGVAELLKNRDFDGLKQLVENENPADDCSCISFKRTRK